MDIYADNQPSAALNQSRHKNQTGLEPGLVATNSPPHSCIVLLLTSYLQKKSKAEAPGPLTLNWCPPLLSLPDFRQLKSAAA